MNTFYVTAPFEGFSESLIKKYLVGPDYNQVRAISDNSVAASGSKESQLEELSKLSVGVHINNFVTILGEPILINNEPTFDIRTDLPLNKQWELEE